MKLTRHIFFYKGEDIIPLFGLTSSNTYIIRGERLTIVDPGAGVGPHLRRVEAAMKHDRLRFDNIMKVILTHAHPDHAQSLRAIRGRLVAQIYCHPLEKDILENPGLLWDREYERMGPFAREVMMLPRPWIQWLARVMFGPMVPVSGDIVAVRHGAALNLGASARVVELPGHRPGEIGIHMPDDNALIIGDLINYKMYDIPSVNMPESDLRQAMASIRLIRELDVETLAPAHDYPLTGRMKIREWLDDTLARCGRMIDQAAQALAAKPGIPLPRLGAMLAAGNAHINFFQRRMLAFNALKALEPEDRLSKEDHE
jgi:glyoxylase-like metal-dependent hydrolase (beta-lactamase superfamily II)